MTDEPRTAFLGLRSNVHFFASHQGLLARKARVKALALLYDRVVFENGVYECTIGEEGSVSWVMQDCDPRQLKPLRTRHGAPFNLRAALTGTDDYHSVIATSTIKRFRAQFVDIWEELLPLNPDWAYRVHFEEGGPLVTDADRLARDWGWTDRAILREVETDRPHYLRNALFDHLYTDLARAFLMRFDLTPDANHEKLIHHMASASASDRRPSGDRTLRLLFPNIHQASWEDIAELRKDRGLQNFRAKLRECDASAETDPAIHRQLIDELAQDIEKYRSGWRGTALTLAWNFVSLAPGMSYPVAIAQTIDSVRNVLRERSHWTVTYLALRRRIANQAPRAK